MILKDIEWMPVVDYPNYIVSEYGEVKNIKTGYVLNTKSKDNYLTARLSKYGEIKKIAVSRLVALAFIGNPPDDVNVNCSHIDGNVLNNHFTNLKWANQKECSKNNQGRIYNSIQEENQKYKPEHDFLFWKTIPTFSKYEITEDGMIRNRETKRLRLNILKSGYHTVCLQMEKLPDAVRAKSTTARINRLVAITYIGLPPDENYHCAHIDGNPLNNHFSNLRWATAQENNDDKRIHDTILKGEKNPSAKLTWDDVVVIRKSKKTNRALGEEYNISHSTIGRIRQGLTWK